MDRKVFVDGNSLAKDLGEYLLSQFDVDGNLHCKSAIVIPSYNTEGKLYNIDVSIADAAEEENAFPIFLNAKQATE